MVQRQVHLGFESRALLFKGSQKKFTIDENNKIFVPMLVGCWRVRVIIFILQFAFVPRPRVYNSLWGLYKITYCH